MKNAHIRVLVVLAILSLLGIVGTQVFWLNRAIAQQDQVFNYNVQVALRNVVESLCEANGRDFPSINPIEQISGNYFIVRTNDRIDLTNLEYLISAEIKKRAISQNFEYGVYDCASNQMVYADNIMVSNNRNHDPIPVLKNDEYYFGVYFPEKSRTLYAGIDLWKFTAVITLVVILFFGYALFVILRQKRLSEVQKDFINNVSHELKTPLATLTLASDTLSGKVSGEHTKYLDIITKEVSRLQKSVENILHASVVESDSSVQKERIALNAFLTELMEQYKETYQSKMVGWELHGMAPKEVLIDTGLLKNCLDNLVDNAVKYGGKNIRMAMEQNEQHVTISISDDGMGIPKAHQKRIFQKFYRVPDVRQQHNRKGFGLGLQIVKSSIAKLRGKITCTSVINEGSTFKITLPNG